MCCTCHILVHWQSGCGAAEQPSGDSGGDEKNTGEWKEPGRSLTGRRLKSCIFSYFSLSTSFDRTRLHVVHGFFNFSFKICLLFGIAKLIMMEERNAIELDPERNISLL